MRFPSLVRVVRIYLSSLEKRDSSSAAIALLAMKRLGAQRTRVEGGLGGVVLDFMAAQLRGDKKEEARLLAELADQVRPRHDDDGG